MKKYLVILALISIPLNQILITPSYDQHLVRRTKDIETTESWDEFLTKLLSTVFKTEQDITIPQDFSNIFFEALRNNGPTTRSIELQNLIRHAYFALYHASPSKEILSAFCEITVKELQAYSFNNFYATDSEHTVSYTIKEPSRLKETAIDPDHLYLENLYLKNQQEQPFEEKSYSQLVEFYRNMIEIYPERTRYYFHLAWALSGLESPTDNRYSMIFTEWLSMEFSPIPLYVSRSKIAIVLKNNRQLNSFIIDWSSYRSQPLFNRTDNTTTMVAEHALKYAIQFPELFQNQDGEWIEPYLENGEHTEELLAAIKLYEARAKDILRSDGVEIYGFWKDDILQYMAMVPETGEIVGFRMRKSHNGVFEAVIDTFYKISAPTVKKIQDQARIPFAEKNLVLLVNKNNEVMPPKDDLPDPLRIYRQPEQVAEFSIFKLTHAMYEPALEIIDDRILSQDGIGVILVGGVTSAGKSPGTEIISARIESEGRRVVTLPMDMYFRYRDTMPTIEYTDSTGQTHIMKDFDNPQAVDIERFRDDLRRLLNGEEVDIPRFDFDSGRSYPTSGVKLQLMEGDVLIIEGIHAPNAELTGGIIPDSMANVTIFVDASREIRLVRRILRDLETRNYSPIRTINQWPIVIMAEDKYIYPNIDNVDIVINTDPNQDVWLESESYKRFISAAQQAYLEAIGTGDARNIINTLQLLLEYKIEIPQIIQNGIPSQ